MIHDDPSPAHPAQNLTAWILLRGLTREAGHWGAFLPELARAVPEARILPVDLPGAGRLWQQRCPWHVEGMVELCRQQLREQAVAPPYRLLGLSLGGMVAAAWAAAWPEELLGCALINTSMRPFSPPHTRLRPARLPVLLSLLVARDGRRAEQTVLQLTSAAPQRHAALIDDWQAIRRARPVSAANAVRQLAAAARYRHPGPRPAMPVLVLSSQGDALVNAACSRALAGCWGVEHAIHPSAGHDLPLDDGPWLAARLAEWSRRRCPAFRTSRSV